MDDVTGDTASGLNPLAYTRLYTTNTLLPSEINLSTLKLSESSQPLYPKLRLRAACAEWGTQMSLCLAQSGCAAVLLLWRIDLMAMERSDRDKCEKIFGALLSGRGPLRDQAGLRHSYLG